MILLSCFPFETNDSESSLTQDWVSAAGLFDTALIDPARKKLKNKITAVNVYINFLPTDHSIINFS